MHQFGWVSEKGGNFLNLLHNEGGTQNKGEVFVRKGGRVPMVKVDMPLTFSQ